MKLNLLIASVVLSAAMTGCSDDALEKEQPIKWNPDGTGYVSLVINLPTSHNGARSNDNFNDGNDGEYKVNDACLMIFSGSSQEGEAVLSKAYDLNLSMNMVGTDKDQITSSAKVAQQIEKTSGSSLYALVLLNAKSTGLLTTDNGQIKTFCGMDLTAGNVTFNKLKNAVQEYEATHYYNSSSNSLFFMTNAPLTTAQSTTGGEALANSSMQTLVKINTGQVYGSEAEANSGTPSADIFVERNLAKVTLDDNGISGEFVYDGTQDPQKSVPYKILAWTLDNTNKRSYAFRHVDAGWNEYRSLAQEVRGMNTGYRFVGHDQVETGTTTAPHYRLYWAEDPNYDTNGVEGTDFQRASEVNLDVTKPAYCLENTFNVAHMNQKETTRVLFKVQYGDGTADYYAYNNDSRTLCKKDDLTALAQKTILTLPYVVNWEKDNKKTLTVDNFVVTLTDGADGTVSISAKSKNIDGAEQSALDELDQNATEYLQRDMPGIVKFAKGVAYYSALVKHFGDDLTPWNGTGAKQEWEAGNQPSFDSPYPGSDDVVMNNYLGRYGVVRNNWYQLTVSKVLRIGSPIIPTIPDKPDDVIESYIGVRVNVLAWTVRNQDITLQ